MLSLIGNARITLFGSMPIVEFLWEKFCPVDHTLYSEAVKHNNYCLKMPGGYHHGSKTVHLRAQGCILLHFDSGHDDV
jgi:hypothetical protein